jgi:xylulokinase
LTSAFVVLPFAATDVRQALNSHLLILDVGSSALKAVLFDHAGNIAGVASHLLSTRASAQQSVEQDVESWWRATRAAIAKLPASASVRAVALTGSMQNVIALSEDGRPLGPAILYSDRRLTAGEIEELASRLPADYAQRTGNRLDPAHCILKLMHLERFAPDAAAAARPRLLFGAKDAVIFRMTGKSVIDPTTASTTGLFDMRAGCWDKALVAASGAAPESLPSVIAADEIAGNLLTAAAIELGLPAGIPIFNGAGDAAAATWGAFADQPGSAYAYIGTTGWVAATQTMAEADPPLDIYTLADPIHGERAVLISPFLTAGSAVDWLSEITSLSVDALLDQAAREDDCPPSALFLPYLCGERAPFEDRSVRGAFLGLDRTQRPGALCYAVLEGIAFAIRHNLDAAGLPNGVMCVIGGGARSAVQRRLLADVTARDLLCPEASQETPALGVYRMVAPQIGFQPVQRPSTDSSTVVRARPERAARLDERFRAYLDLSRFAQTYSALLSNSI